MNGVITKSNFPIMDETNITEEYRRQAELMYLKSYATWLSMREKIILAEVKKPA